MKTRQKSSFLLTVHFISICVFSNRDLVEEEDKEVPLENLERRCAEPLEHTHIYLHKHGNTNLALSLIMNQCGSRVESGWCLLLNDRPICSSLHSLLKEETEKNKNSRVAYVRVMSYFFTWQGSSGQDGPPGSPGDQVNYGKTTHT